MADGLSLNAIVSVEEQLQPQGATGRNFGNLLILGDSDVVDITERLRLYTDLEDIGTDYGTTAPEYLAAQVFLAALPTPPQLYLGRWASNPTSGRLLGAALTAAQQVITLWTGITDGAFAITVDGAVQNPASLDFSQAANMNGVASVIQTAISGVATCVWNAAASRFEIKSATSGVSSSVSFATSPAEGTDVSGMLGLTATSSGARLVAGIASETLESAVNQLAAQSNDWYGLEIASAAAVADADYVSVASIIEALSVSRVFGVTTQEAEALDPLSTTDLAYLLSSGGFQRAICQYSSTNPYAVGGIFGTQFTTDFGGVNTLKTVKFQTEAGVQAETLTAAQAAALAAKNCNVYVNYASGSNTVIAIVQEGTMANGLFFDEVYGIDWLMNEIQVDVFNALATAGTKIPQTDAGANRVEAAVAAALLIAQTNGLIAPGVWQGTNLGAIVTGQVLPTGFYLYLPPVSSLTQQQRAGRQLPLIQAAIILAGAVHFAGVLLTIQR